MKARLPLFQMLEPRRLFASVIWNIGISGAGTAGLTQQQQTELANFVELTGNEWAALIPGSTTGPVELRVNVIVDAAAAGSAGRLSARSVDNVAVGTEGEHLFEQRATVFARYGRDSAFQGADIELGIDPGYFKSSLWFDPSPQTRLTNPTPVQAGKIDAYSAILHEMGHAFFFNGLLDETTYTPIDTNNASDRSTFDKFVTVTGNQPFFTGSRAVAEYGGNIPLTRQNLYHLGNLTGAGAELVSAGALMNGEEFNTAQRYAIGDLERAIAADLIEIGTQIIVDPPPPPPEDPVTFTFTGNVTFPYTAANGAAVQVRLTGVSSGSGSGQIVFPFGTSTSNPSGDPLSIQVFGTDSRSSLLISASKAIQIPELTISSPRGLLTLDAPNVTLTGSTVLAGLGTLKLGQLAGGSLVIGNAVKGNTFAVGGVFDSNLTLPSAKTVTLGTFFDSDSTPNALTVGAVSTLNINGDLGGRLQINGALGRASVASITDASLNIAGAVTSLTVRGTVAGSTISGTKWGNISIAGNLSNSVISATTTLANVTVGGALSGTTLVGAAGVGAVSVGSASSSRVIAGLSPLSSLPSSLPTSQAFTSPKAAIRSFTTRTGPFASTLILAPTIGATTLGQVSASNSSTKFGVFADTLTSLSASTPQTPSLKLKRTTAPTTLSESDFSVTVV